MKRSESIINSFVSSNRPLKYLEYSIKWFIKSLRMLLSKQNNRIEPTERKRATFQPNRVNISTCVIYIVRFILLFGALHFPIHAFCGGQRRSSPLSLCIRLTDLGLAFLTSITSSFFPNTWKNPYTLFGTGLNELENDFGHGSHCISSFPMFHPLLKDLDQVNLNILSPERLPITRKKDHSKEIHKYL